MRRVQLIGLLAMAAMVAATVAMAAGTLPPGNRNPALLNGTFGFSFNGGFYNDTTARASGAGTITFDGRGNVVGGIIHCDENTGQRDSAITGGRYSVNLDGSGYVTINTALSGPNDDYVCNTGNAGVDLFISVVSGGAKIRFATDGSGNFYDTGYFVPFNGEMDAE